jgi:hypothetical protein
MSDNSPVGWIALRDQHESKERHEHIEACPEDE